MKVVLTGLGIWIEKTLVQIFLNLQETLQNFKHWKDWNLLRGVKHDAAHVIIGQILGKSEGHAVLSGYLHCQE